LQDYSGQSVIYGQGDSRYRRQYSNFELEIIPRK